MTSIWWITLLTLLCQVPYSDRFVFGSGQATSGLDVIVTSSNSDIPGQEGLDRTTVDIQQFATGGGAAVQQEGVEEGDGVEDSEEGGVSSIVSSTEQQGGKAGIFLVRDPENPHRLVKRRNQSLAGHGRLPLRLPSTSSNTRPGPLPSPSKGKYDSLDRRLLEEEVFPSIVEEVLASSPSDTNTKMEESSTETQAMPRNMQDGDGSSILADNARFVRDVVVTMPGQDEAGVLQDQDGFENIQLELPVDQQQMQEGRSMSLHQILSDMAKAELPEADKVHEAAQEEDSLQSMVEEHFMSPTHDHSSYNPEGVFPVRDSDIPIQPVNQQNQTEDSNLKSGKRTISDIEENAETDFKKRIRHNENDFAKLLLRDEFNAVTDSYWVAGEATPFSSLAKTFEALEFAPKKALVILSNYFRSVWIKNPADLLPSIYLTLNRLAPAGAGVELGLEDNMILKAVAAACCLSTSELKTNIQAAKDIGQVAKQYMDEKIFKPTILQVCSSTNQSILLTSSLTTSKVFDTLSKMTKNSGSEKEIIGMIKPLLLACMGSEARFLIKLLGGDLRLGVNDHIMLKSLAQAVTPLSKEHTPKKAELAKLLQKLKIVYNKCESYDILISSVIQGKLDNMITDSYAVTIESVIEKCVNTSDNESEVKFKKIDKNKIGIQKMSRLKLKKRLYNAVKKS